MQRAMEMVSWHKTTLIILIQIFCIKTTKSKFHYKNQLNLFHTLTKIIISFNQKQKKPYFLSLHILNTIASPNILQ